MASSHDLQNKSNGTVRTAIALDRGWTFHATDDPSRTRPVAQFPTNIHLDLLHHGIIPDPNYGKNELQVQWVGEKDWTYKTTFVVPHLAGLAPTDETSWHYDLVFEGLDTFATVKLNSNILFTSENMFLPVRIDCGELLKQGTNELEIEFESCWRRGKEEQEKYPNHNWACWNGDPSRLAVRKAQYQYGWDWGPKLLTCGPWRPIVLECWQSRIRGLHFTTELSESLREAKIRVKVDCEGLPKTVASHVKVEIALRESVIASEIILLRDGGLAELEFHSQSPELWYPHGYGSQPLYDLTATLFTADLALDTVNKRFGIRSAKVIRRPLLTSPGRSFFFLINNTPIFCGGSNWIPPSSFSPSVSPRTYRTLLNLAASGNQIMLRVWGGGIYESSLFYSLCDELGILVWQDFMFSCGNYPLLPSITAEATAQVLRLRHHPCIVIFAGNNEDYQIRESEGLTYDPEDRSPSHWLNTNFPARYIYEHILPKIMSTHLPDTYYHRGSPWGLTDSRDPTEGDIHQWSVWHTPTLPYQSFRQLTGRFVSEFGMQSLPSLATISSFISLSDREAYAQSPTLEFHNKALDATGRLATYLATNIRFTYHPLASFVYATQLIQSEMLSFAYEAMRCRWLGPGHELCAGGLMWQYNDCYPGPSWSIVDAKLRPKPAYYALKRALDPLKVYVHPADGPWKQGSVDLRIWISNLRLKDKLVSIRIRLFAIATGSLLYEAIHTVTFTIKANRAEEYTDRVSIAVGQEWDEWDILSVVDLLRVDEPQPEDCDREVLATGFGWPQPLKYCPIQGEAGVELDILVGVAREGHSIVEVKADRPVKGLVLDVVEAPGESADAESREVHFSDNGFDLVPGEARHITMEGYHGGKLVAMWLNKGL